MAINIVRFQHQNLTCWGVLHEQQIALIPGDFPTTGDLVRGVRIDELKALPLSDLTLPQVSLLAPVTRNQQFICQGANYRQHMIESGMNPDAKNFNMIFTKAQSCIVAADSAVIKPAVVKFLDYEIELGLIMRREITGKVNVTEQNLHEFIAGLVIVNDYSARDIQIPQMQFYKGKSFRTFGPIGPWLCLLEAADMHYLKKLQLRLTVNGEVRQNDSTANLVHGPLATLNEMAGIQDLFPGDLIATGTPAGCALRIPSQARMRFAALLPEKKKWALFLKAQAARSQYLQVGDKVEASIRSSDGLIDLGVQHNLVVADD